MANEIRTFDCTIPAGTAKDSPVTVKMTFPPRLVAQLNIRVPPGPNGHVGFQITSGGVPIFPSNYGAWVIDSDNYLEWPLSDQIDSGAWELTGYNTGTFDHTIYVTFLLDVIAAPSSSTVTPLAASAISAPPVFGSSGTQVAGAPVVTTLPAPVVAAPPSVTAPSITPPPTETGPSITPPPTIPAAPA